MDLACSLRIYQSKKYDLWTVEKTNLEKYSVENTESVGFLLVEALQQSRNNYKVLIKAVILPYVTRTP